ncbi:MAG: cytochrome c [Acidimicrobiia bacterium]|jgi:mono/diheme cytochrome c family protein
MRNPAARTIALVGVLSVVLGSCAAEPATIEADIEPQDPQLVAAGEELYTSNCAECHGDDLRGTDAGPAHLSEVYVPSHHSDGAFLVAVRAGSPQHHWDFGAMPPVEGLTDSDVEAIVAFVRERQRTEGFESYPP